LFAQVRRNDIAVLVGLRWVPWHIPDVGVECISNYVAWAVIETVLSMVGLLRVY
jgi:hypothetical protein